MRAVGGPRRRWVAVYRELWTAVALFAVTTTTSIVVGLWLLHHEDSPLPLAAVAAFGLLALNGEAALYRSYRRKGLYALRFLQLYRSADQRGLAMDEENELWSIVVRRLHFSSLQTMLQFRPGTRPGDDAFLRSAYDYLDSSYPNVVEFIRHSPDLIARKAS